MGLPLSSGISDAVLALSGKPFCAILVLMTLVSNGVKKLTESFTSVGGIISMPLFNFTFIYRFGGKSFTIRNIGSIDYLFDFNNAWMIFVRTDNISSRLYAGVFKICAKGFWFSATAISNSIYVTTIKQFSQLFFNGNDFIFMNNCYVVFPMKPLFIRNSFMNFKSSYWLLNLSQ